MKMHLQPIKLVEGTFCSLRSLHSDGHSSYFSLLIEINSFVQLVRLSESSLSYRFYTQRKLNIDIFKFYLYVVATYYMVRRLTYRVERMLEQWVKMQKMST